MARRKVDVSMLTDLMQGSAGQEISRGVRLTDDPNFPLFSTPLNQDILVYFPRVNMIVNENGEDMGVLSVFIHDYKKGKYWGKLRCINGLSGSPAFDALGYDGTCPICEATNECWELYNKKLEVEAQRLGIDPQNDPSNALAAVKQTLRDDMDIKGAQEFVTFPVVIIPTKGKMIPADDAINNLKCVFVQWRRKRYEDNILAQLDALRNNPGHPAGKFFFWKFTYDTQGRQATPMLAAKNAKYTLIQDDADLQALIPACEAAAKEFTLVKATEVIVSNQFMYKADIEDEVDKIMAKTRTFLSISDTNGAPAIEAGNANPLAQFGNANTVTQAPQIGMGTQNLGVNVAPPVQAAPTPQAQPQQAPPQFGGFGAPVQFGN